MNKIKLSEGRKKAAPWFFGIGIGGGTALLGTLCTIPKTGKCAACGSCLFSIAALAGWALLKGKDSDSIYSRQSK